jgi:hypothetical protein
MKRRFQFSQQKPDNECYVAEALQQTISLRTPSKSTHLKIILIHIPAAIAVSAPWSFSFCVCIPYQSHATISQFSNEFLTYRQMICFGDFQHVLLLSSLSVVCNLTHIVQFSSLLGLFSCCCIH